MSRGMPCTVKHLMNVLSKCSAWAKCLHTFGIFGETEINVYQVPVQSLLRIELNSAELKQVLPRGRVSVVMSVRLMTEGKGAILLVKDKATVHSPLGYG